MMEFARASAIGVSLIMCTRALGAQATPFLFGVTPSAGASKSVAAFGYYELGYGERTFEPVAGDRLEQAPGVRATIGSSVMLLARWRHARLASRGPILHATRSGFASAADRPLPARNGYVLRSAVGFNW